jgi:hypothetical protein
MNKEYENLLQKKKSLSPLESYSVRPIEVKFEAKFYDSNGKSPTVYVSGLIEYFLFDLFLIMNIAAPAAYNLYSAEVNRHNMIVPNSLGLSNHLFETSFLLSKEQGGPKIDFIPAQDVINWFFSVRSEIRMVPQNRMEKVLFALLHIAKTGVSPNTIVWLFYALETLFDTKAGENFSALISRAKLLLQMTDKDTKILKKRMRELYNLRSAFVHGGST